MWTRRSILASGAASVAGAAQAGEDSTDPLVACRRAMAEARRLQVRADRLLRGQRLVRGTVAERFTALFADQRFLYPDSDIGRDQAVAAMNARLTAIRPRLAAAFGDLAIPGAQVRRMSPEDEAMRRGGYREPPAYYVDLAAIRDRPAWTLPSVAFHETVPGHALQAALASANVVNSEAWAIYAEQLCADLGAYAGDPRGELGYLHWRLFRMARIVADIGLDTMDWSAERAVAEMKALQGHPIAFATLEADVARMQNTPGVYAAQGLGALDIARGRPQAIASWPTFHRAMLRGRP